MNYHFRHSAHILFPILFTLLVLSFAKPVFSQPSWERTYGGAIREYGFSVQQTSDGGYIVAGMTNSYGAGNYDVYLVKTNANGDTLWTKTFGGTSDDRGYSVQQTIDGGYIVGGMTNGNQIYLIKADSNGDMTWEKDFGAGTWSEWGYSVQQTTDSGYIVAGTTTFNSDIYIIKVNTNGDTLWSKTIGGLGYDYGYSIQQTSDGGYILAGSTGQYLSFSDVYIVKTNAFGDTIWTKIYGGTQVGGRGRSVKQTLDGGYIVSGNTSVNGQIYLIKTDINGDSIWSKTFGGSGWDYGESVQQTTDGGYIIAGHTELSNNAYQVYLIKTNTYGDILWTRTFGGVSLHDYSHSVQQTTDGGYIISGETWSFGDSLQIYLIKTDVNGNVGVAGNKPETIAPPSHLLTAYPNPTIGNATFKYSVPRASNVTLEIYNIAGQAIKTLVNEYRQPGYYGINWDGNDATGRKVASGIYFYRLQMGKYENIKKLIVLK